MTFADGDSAGPADTGEAEIPEIGYKIGGLGRADPYNENETGDVGGK